MQNILKSLTLKIIAGLIALASLCVIGANQLNQMISSGKLGNVNSGNYYVTTIDTAPATSTVSYIQTASATSSISFNSQLADAIDLDLIAMASTSADTLIYSYEYSNNNSDWFAPASNSASVSLATTTSNFARINRSIPTALARYTRVNLSVVGSTTIWAEIALRIPSRY